MIIDSYRNMGETPWIKATVSDILHDMDENDIDMSVVGLMGRYAAVDNREGNKLLIEAQKNHGDRLLCFATVNPWLGSKRITEELNRSVLSGLKGISINPAVQGVASHSPLMYPVTEAAINLKVPLYIHSGTPSYGLPLQIIALAERYPEAIIIMGHMGGADFYVDLASSIDRAPNIYLETSASCHVGYLEEGFRVVGPDSMVFGSDYPYSDTKSEIIKVTQTTMSDGEKEKILGTNAAALFGIRKWRI